MEVVEPDVLVRVEEVVVQLGEHLELREHRRARGARAARDARHRVLHRLVLELHVEDEQQQRLVRHGVVRLRLVAREADEGGVEALEQRLDRAPLEEHRLAWRVAPDQRRAREHHLLRRCRANDRPHAPHV